MTGHDDGQTPPRLIRIVFQPHVSAELLRRIAEHKLFPEVLAVCDYLPSHGHEHRHGSWGSHTHGHVHGDTDDLHGVLGHEHPHDTDDVQLHADHAGRYWLVFHPGPDLEDLPALFDAHDSPTIRAMLLAPAGDDLVERMASGQGWEAAGIAHAQYIDVTDGFRVDGISWNDIAPQLVREHSAVAPRPRPSGPRTVVARTRTPAP